jgi:osmoprotectant transport system permease protein
VGSYLSNSIYQQQILTDLGQHLYLAFVPILLALVISVPLGWLASRTAAARAVILGTTSVIYTIPSLALFVALPFILGTPFTGSINIVVALTAYTTCLLTRSTVGALDALPPATLTAATAMGFTPARRFLTVELPLAVPVIAAGLRVAVVSNVSLVSIGALIGTGGLGDLFTFGFARNFVPPQLVGIVLVALVALVGDAVVVAVQRALTPWQRAVAS